MKGVVLTTDGKMLVKDFSEEEVYRPFRMYMHPQVLSDSFYMILSSTLREEPRNEFGSYLCGQSKLRNLIFGNIVIMAKDRRNSKHDIIGLTYDQIVYIKFLVHSFFGERIREVSDNEHS